MNVSYCMIGLEYVYCKVSRSHPELWGTNMTTGFSTTLNSYGFPFDLGENFIMNRLG